VENGVKGLKEEIWKKKKEKKSFLRDNWWHKIFE
jgi:hypothetical protein